MRSGKREQYDNSTTCNETENRFQKTYHWEQRLVIVTCCNEKRQKNKSFWIAYVKIESFYFNKRRRNLYSQSHY